MAASNRIDDLDWSSGLMIKIDDQGWLPTLMLDVDVDAYQGEEVRSKSKGYFQKAGKVILRPIRRRVRARATDRNLRNMKVADR
jgi:hypothetical protein